ncbi:MAG: hypothetical protein JM58_18790 [Peptococcaceae bacterium BICA1-8]|nr:MAG: hypothetical protein JM58_18790 [Peptococcaceae bacterium BICA1-8]
MKNKSNFINSLSNALLGFIYCVRSENHFRIHLKLAGLALALSWFFQISASKWLLVVFSITLVLSLEMLNTAIERAIDLYTGERHPLAQVAKDVAAGAVLVAALNALIVGAVVFLPEIYRYF